jgi:hypothetical protein
LLLLVLPAWITLSWAAVVVAVATGRKAVVVVLVVSVLAHRLA